MRPDSRTLRGMLWTALLAAASSAVLVSALGVSFFPVKGDELTVAWMGKQAAMGRTPYLEYFSVCPPLLIYGLAMVFKAFGASLAVLRVLTLLWLLGVTLVLDCLFLRTGMTRPWAAGAAFLFPALFLPFWPLPSHHWFALGFGLAGLWAAWAAAGAGSGLLWFCSGLLAACSGLCLQTEGALFCTLVLLTIVLLAPHPARKKAALLASAGLALPLLLFLLILSLQGALPDAFHDLVTWPLRYYKQPGGFNDKDIVGSVASELSRRWPEALSWGMVTGFLAYCAALLLGLLAPVSAALSPAWTCPDGGAASLRRWAFSAAGLLAAWLVFLRGRSEWVHLTLFIPVMLLLAARELDWDGERIRPLAAKALLGFALAVSALRWAGVWAGRPPLLGDILRVDALVRDNSVPSVLKQLPLIGGQPPPVVFLPHGADLYFYWAPAPPPMDWIEPPSFGINAPGDYESLASFLTEKRIPYVLIQSNFAAMFLEQPSPLQRVLSTDYRPAGKTAAGLLFERVPDAPPAP